MCVGVETVLLWERKSRTEKLDVVGNGIPVLLLWMMYSVLCVLYVLCVYNYPGKTR